MRFQRGSSMFDFNLNGKAASSVGVLAVRRPNIPTPQLRYETVTIPNVSGGFIQSENAYDLIKFEVECNFLSSSPETFNEEARAVRSWLFSEQSSQLSFSDDPDWCYLTKVIQPSDIERTSRCVGVFTITVICEPYVYLLDGLTEVDLPTHVSNLYETAKPIYKLNGSGQFQINLKRNIVSSATLQLRITVTNSCTIDTQLEIAYGPNGLDQVQQISRGDISDLIIPHGGYTFTKTVPDGGSITYIPRWRSL